MMRISDASDDSVLTFLLGVAAERAETYMSNDFTHVDLETGAVVEDPIPDTVVLGCYMCVGRWYQHVADGLTTEQIGKVVNTWDIPQEATNLWHDYKRYYGLFS